MASVSLAAGVESALAGRLTDDVLPGLEAILQRLTASADDWHDLLSQVLEARAAGTQEAFREQAERWRQSIADGSFSLTLELRTAEELQGANGAYVAPGATPDERILLNADWAATASDSDLERVLLEELGHALDQRLNPGSDSAGDEGELFAALALGLSLDDAEWTRIHAESDITLLSIDGVSVQVEQSAGITAPAGVDGSVKLYSSRYVFKTADFNFTDADGDSLAAVRISSLPASGSLLLNGQAVIVGTEVSAADLLAGKLVYSASTTAQTTNPSFTFQVRDDGASNTLDSTPNTLTLNFVDTDGDAVRDIWDLDDDNDGILDTVEAKVAGTVPLANTISFSYAQTAGVAGGVAGYPSRHDAAGLYGSGASNDPRFLFDGNLNTELRVHSGDIFEFNLGQTIKAGSTITLFEGTGSNDADVAIYATFGSTDPSGNLNNATGGGMGWANLQAALSAGTAVLLYSGPSSATQVLTLGIDVTHVQIVGLGSHGGFAEFTLTTSIDTNLDTDGDGIANSRDLDSDNDGISDLAESVGWDPSASVMTKDANRDGTIDLSGNSFGSNGVWTGLAAGGTTPRDSDNDGVVDFLDLDSDADGIPDTVELRPTAGYGVNDGDVRNEDADGDGVIARFDSNDASGVNARFGGTFLSPVNTDASGEATSGGLNDASGFVVADYWATGTFEYKGGSTYAVLKTRSADNVIDDADGYAKVKYNADPTKIDSYVVDFGKILVEGTVISFSAANNSDATVASPDLFTVKQVSDPSGTDVSGTTQTYKFEVNKGTIVDFKYTVGKGGLRYLEFQNEPTNSELRLDYVTYTDKVGIAGTPIPDYLDRDSDGDGLLDSNESGLTLTRIDANRDGIDDGLAASYQDPDGSIATDPSATPLSTLKNNDATAADVDYRSLNTGIKTVSNIQVNEASPWAVFTVSCPGTDRQVRLALQDGTANGEPSGNDFGAVIQYRASNGGDWTTYDGSSLITVPGSGTLLVRVAIRNDLPAVFEGAETFRLLVTDGSGNTFDPSGGSGTIFDDGTGNIWLASNLSSDPDVVDGSGNPLVYDDDRKLVTINDLTINEGSGTAASPRYAVFTLTGNPGQQITNLDLSGNSATERIGTASIDVSGGTTDFGGTNGLQYRDASGVWQNYTSGNVFLDASGSLLVRVAIFNDNLLEVDSSGAGETFNLIATYTDFSGNVGAIATGTGTIRDDGTGLLWDLSGNLDPSGALDDDSPINISNLTINEASAWAILDLEGKANQSYTLSLQNQSATGWDGSGSPDLSGGTTDFGGSVAIQYLDASGNWQNYTGGSISLDAFGEGEIRVRIINDTFYEGASGETFRVVATSNGIGSTDGVVTIRDDATGNYYDPSGQLDASGVYVLDDDRPLSISGATFNEGSSFIQWTVTGAAGQRVLFSADPSGTTGDALVGPSGDITASDLQYYNGSSWVAFDASSNVVLDASGSLLIRTKVRNDSIDEIEANEGFVLRVKNTGGADASGISFLNDDGSGVLLDASGMANFTTLLDDDRPLVVGGEIYNESSSFIQWKVTGAAGQRVLFSADPSGTTGDALVGPSGDITASDLQYYNGSSWVGFDASSNVVLDASGSLLIRTKVRNDSIDEIEANEGFVLRVKNTGGADASGISYLNDDGSGVFVDPSGILDVSGINVLDDDRPLTISNPSVNENSSYVVFKVTGQAYQELRLNLPGQGLGNSASQWDGSSNRDPYEGDADYGPTLEVWNGTAWQSYTPDSLTRLDASGSLLVRTPLHDDFVYESGLNNDGETFRLIATNTGGTDASGGVARIFDDGTGLLFDPSGSPDSSGNPAVVVGLLDNDLQDVSVDGGIFNEGSDWAVFVVTGVVKETVGGIERGYRLAVADQTTQEIVDESLGDPSGQPLIKYSVDAGVTWSIYVPGSIIASPGASEKVLVAVDIRGEQDDEFETEESLILIAEDSADTDSASGAARIVDAGNGLRVSVDQSGNPIVDLSGNPVPLTTGFADDDRPLSVGGGIFNEGSSHIFWTVSGIAGAAGQRVVFGNLTPDSSGADVVVDLSGNLEFFDASSGTWTPFDGSSNAFLDASASLLIRQAINNDGTYEGKDTFRLHVRNGGGIDASGVSSLIDDGTGLLVDGSGNPTGGTPDDDRTLDVSGGLYNEGSSHIFWTISGTAGQVVGLNGLVGDPSGTALPGDPSGDLTGALEYRNSSGSWVTFDASGTALDASGTLLIRKAINNDAPYEGREDFVLSVGYVDGATFDASGVSSLIDDGTGLLVDGSGNPTAGTPDDDRTLDVSGGLYNEGSSHIFWTISGTAGQVVGLNGLVGDPSGTALPGDPSGDLTGALEYRNSSGSWVTFDASGTALDASGTLLIRKAINNDAPYEGREDFVLSVGYVDGATFDASGVSSLIDDGTGLLVDGSGNPTAGTPDDDRTLDVSGGLYNEGSSHIFWTISGTAGQVVGLNGLVGDPSGTALPGDPSGDLTGALEYRNSSGSWVTFDGSGAVLDASGTLLIRKAINNDAPYEGQEDFVLSVGYVDGATFDASGVSSLIDDGTGLLVDGSGNPTGGTPDDDRTLDVSGGLYNEGSSHIFWTINGTAGQVVGLNGLVGDPSGSALPVDPSGDLTGALEYRNSSGSWVTFDGSGAVLDASGTLLIRKAITNDAPYEGQEDFVLSVGYVDGATFDASGVSSLIDDGTGLLVDGSGNPTGGTPDDDRTLDVSGGLYNEGSSHIFWTISGTAGQVVGLNGLVGDPSGTALPGDPSGDLSGNLEYLNSGGTWVTFDASGAALDASGTLLIRKAITNDAPYEGQEDFVLSVGYVDGATFDASGVSSLIDDGTGLLVDGSGNPTGGTPDDDRTLDVSGGLYNEGSSHIFWTISGTAGQVVGLNGLVGDPSGSALPGDPSGDLSGNLEYLNSGGTWVTFDASGAALDASGTLLIRKAITNDAPYEGQEDFVLSVGYVDGATFDASGVSSLIDDGTGLLVDGSGNPTGGTPDDDRTLDVSGGLYNEGSSHIFWTISGTAGQVVGLNGLVGDPSGTALPADPSGDLSGNLEYLNSGGTWVTFDGSGAVLDASGMLLIRKAINNDAPYEGQEDFVLSVGYVDGATFDASGVSSLIDDGTGSLVDGSGNPAGGTPDDDRTLDVSGGLYNEGSSHIFWTISGTAGQVVGLNGLVGEPSGSALPGDPSGDLSGNLEYLNSGGTWVTFDGSGAALDASGTLLIRKAINNDAPYEGQEDFVLSVGYVDGATFDASGVSSLIDDGTGLLVDGSGNPTGGTPDDDRTLDVSGGLYNEGSSHIFWTISGTAGQVVGLNGLVGDPSGSALPGDPSGDLTGALEYRNSSGIWVTFDASGAALDASGTLLIRKAINNDAPYEGQEDFVLSVGSVDGATFDASGVSSLIDDGTGLLVDGSGNPTGGTPDDDRTLDVSGGLYNEGSSHIFWTISGTAGQVVGLNGLVGDPSGSALPGDPSGDLSGNLEYLNSGGTWVTFDGSGAALDASGTLLIRKAITNDVPYEGQEDFVLSVGYVDGATLDASGVSSLIDDGTGLLVDGSGNPTGGTPDDDRTLDVSGGLYNEGSSHIFWTISGTAGQVVGLNGLVGDPSGTALPGDPSGDLSGNLEYLNSGGTWVTFDASGAALDASGTLLIRKAINNDAPYEGQEDFVLSVGYVDGATFDASGVSSLIDDGTGLLVDGSGNPTAGTLDDDRSLTVSGELYNEGSSHIFWTISGTAGQVVGLNSLLGDPPGTALPADPSGDLTGALQYRNSSGIWVTFDASGAALDASGMLLIRKAITNDAPYEGQEDFVLSVGSVDGATFDASGVSSLIDDGTGLLVDGSGNPTGGTPDDDRTLDVSGGLYNEGSSHIFWTISGTAGQVVGLNGLVGDPSGSALPGDPSGDLSGNLEYLNSGGTWVTFDASGAALDASGTLLIRKAITNDAPYEGQEDFVLSVGYVDGATFDASGVSSLIDDGTGLLVDGSGNPTGGTPDDDRTLDVSGGLYNEGSSHIFWTISGTAGQVVGLNGLVGDPSGTALPADPSGDLSGNLEYLNSSGSWVTFDASGAALDASGMLLIRKAITNDAPYEGQEDFVLSVGYVDGATFDASGVSSLIDDGMGLLVDGSGNPTGGTPDDDRTLDVSGGLYNEGSSHIFWTISGTAGQVVGLNGLVGDPSGSALPGDPSGDLSGNLEYLNSGGTWVTFDGSGAALDASGTLLIRKAINNDAPYEGQEDFVLSVGYVDGATFDASGVSSLIDDGTGLLVDGSGNPTAGTLDDDRSLTVSGELYNEGSSHIFWTINGTAGQVVGLNGLVGDPSGTALPGDPSGDLTGALEYRNSSGIWVTFDASGAALDASGTLLIRKAINNDAPYEGQEDFVLSVGYVDGATFDASGVSSLIDDGTGLLVDGSGNPTGGTPDDDRTLDVSGGLYNEGSSHIFWTISGTAGQVVGLNGLVGDPSGTALPADPSGDLTGALQYRNSSGIWVTFDASGAALDASGMLLIRKAITNDAPYEGQEDFVLSVGSVDGATFDASGVSSLIDDGTGLLVDGSGNLTGGTPDDDRTLDVSGGLYNEGSSHIFWTISGTAGQVVGLNSLLGDPSGTALPGDPSGDLSGNLEYLNSGGTWVTFDASGAALDASGTLLIRKAINNDAPYEGQEDFVLSVGYVDGATFDASGVSSLIDDGTGLLVDGSGNPAGGTPDDDRTLDVSGGLYNEGSSHIFWTISGTVGQVVGLNGLVGEPSGSALPGDPSGDLTGALQYRNSSGSWVTFDGSGAALDASGMLLIRKAINNDAPYEGQEDFVLSVGYVDGATLDASGVSSLIDDGTGLLVDGSGNPTGGTPDDDSTFTVNNVSVNEGSPNVVFIVSGAVGQAVFLSIADASGNNSALDPSGGLAELGASPALQYRDGSGIWQAYNANNPPVIIDPSGVLFVRIAITAEQETAFDGPETFRLNVANTSGTTFSGTATIRDDGTGDYWIADSTSAATSQQLEASRISLDDDRTLRVTAYSPVNEASTYAMFAVSAVPGQGLQLALGNTSSLLDVDATISGFTTQWSLDGSTWTEGTSVPAVPDSGIVFVRVTISSEADDSFEGAEAFTQSATYTSGAPLKASGIATIVDNGTGGLYAGGFTDGQPDLIDGPLDDDRSVLSAPDVNVNEASPYVVFQVSANAGQSFSLSLNDGAIGFSGQNDNPADRDRQQAIAGLDYENRIEVYNGKTWTGYTPGTQVSIPAGGSVLLVRVPLINDTPYEGAHAFSLTATPPSGAAAIGRAIIGDFGTGLVFNDSGADDRNAVKDDDRQLKVESPIVNEGSPHVVFQVSGIAGPVELAVQDIGIGTGFADLASPTIQYWNGSNWLDYVGSPLTPGTDFPAGSILLVRVAIGEEQDDDREGAERFNLRVSGVGGPSLGTATIRDDGTGAIWLSDSTTPATPAELSEADITPNDDFDQDGITPTTEEALATLAASQGMGGAPGDLNGDGIADSLQSALATLAWRTSEDFNDGNEGTLTDVEPIISLAVMSDASGNVVSDTLQLANIRVVEYTDSAEFGAASDDVSIDASTGIRRVTLASGLVVSTPWDPMRFEVFPGAGSNSLDDISSREGTQVRALIDVRASNLDASAFNAYIKFVSQATITAAGPGSIIDLDGNPILKEGWYDFTQRASGGDGARFVLENGKITGIELIFTDNAFGDSNALLNRILDPGVPVLIADARLVPTADGKGLAVVGVPGQSLWADFSAVLADANLQNGFNLVRVSPTGERTPIGAIGATPGSGFLGDLRVQLRVGDEVRFSQVSGDLPANPLPDLTVSGSDNCLTVRLDDDGGDGDADDLVLKVKTSETDPYPRNTQMARFQTRSEQAYLDLSWIAAEGIRLHVDVQADAGQTNTISLVRVDTDADGRPLGTVGGLAPAAGAAFDAKVRELALPGLSDSQTGTGAASLSWALTGSQAGVYAPVLFTEDGPIYTFGSISSSDRHQHVKVLGASSFGFEDAPAAQADWDFNDLVVSFRTDDPTTPRLELSRDGHGLTVVGGSGAADGLWLDLNAVLAEAGNQNSFDLFVIDASGARSQVGSVGATSHGTFLGRKELFLGVGESLQFVQNSNADRPNAVVDLRITQIGDRYRVALEDDAGTGGDGDFNDLVLDIDRTPLEPCEEVVRLAGLQRTGSAGLLDLSTIGAEGLNLNLAIQTSSGKTNTLGFVKLDSSSSNGQYSVDGVAAGNSEAFRQAVRDNLIDFRVNAGGEGEAAPAIWELDAADRGIYAAVLLTPDNDVFTFGDDTGADGRQHLTVLGDNSFGFEDLLAGEGSDFDYNDFVVRITPL